MDIAMGFTGNRLFRDGENRGDGALAAALADPLTRIFLQVDGLWLCRETADGIETGFPPDAALPLAAEGADIVLLGHRPDGGGPRLAVRAAARDPVPTGLRTEPLRGLAMGGSLDAQTEGELGQAEHFLNWHLRTAFCGRCGTPTVSDAAGYRRRCPACGEQHFPRTDPVSIMLVHDGAGHCLMGRSPRFPAGMWSCLAGFIEPGETLEAAVRRETLEESGILVGRVDYVASQPWPFPGSLMIGCMALATTSAIVFDPIELEDCRWFGRDEVVAMLAGTHPDGLTAPKPFAIAHHLTRAFVEMAD